MRCSLVSDLPWTKLGRAAVVALVLGSAACGSGASDSPSPFAGHWHGLLQHALTGADLRVDVQVQPSVNAADIYVGNVTTDSSRCFTSGMLTAIDSNGSWMMNAAGSGSATQDCIIAITGQSLGGQITGLLSMTSTLPTDCNIDATAFTLLRD
jgi:hypothetical protein